MKILNLSVYTEKLKIKPVNVNNIKVESKPIQHIIRHVWNRDQMDECVDRFVLSIENDKMVLYYTYEPTYSQHIKDFGFTVKMNELETKTFKGIVLNGNGQMCFNGNMSVSIFKYYRGLNFHFKKGQQQMFIIDKDEYDKLIDFLNNNIK